jgi:hypothetical protein
VDTLLILDCHFESSSRSQTMSVALAYFQRKMQIFYYSDRTVIWVDDPDFGEPNDVVMEEDADDSPNDDIPHKFICCITQGIIKDPVTDREGNSYERTAILKWLKTNGTSPYTRKLLRKDDLVSNYALREEIGNFLRDNPMHDDE